MAKSIIQDTRIRECYLCREEAEKRGYYGELKHTGLHKHHFIYGRFGAFRKKAEHYGLWGYMCAERHHEHGPEAPHNNAVATHLSCPKINQIDCHRMSRYNGISLKKGKVPGHLQFRHR